CKKHNNTLTSQGIAGTWNFLGMKANTQTTVNEGSGVTMKANTSFVTTKNIGQITFSTDSMVVSGLGYTVDTTFMAYFYYNSVLYDSSKQAASYTIPPTSASAKYSILGSDSLYFPKGGILTALDSSATGQGCVYVLQGDSLTLTANGIDTSGGAQTLIQSVISLKRQK
ncbi:MAG TPA: hypothetical protein VGM89_03750, partial [Puia sp.]